LPGAPARGLVEGVAASAHEAQRARRVAPTGPARRPPGPGPAHPIFGLHRTLGNSAVRHLLDAPGLRVGPAGDEQEQAADATARRMLADSTPVAARLGREFRGVRIHTDAVATALGALAFTVGRDVVFAPGRYAPGTAAGDRLLAHELAHVSQGGHDVIRRAADPTYPTATERERVAGILPPASAGPGLGPVVDPGGFRAGVMARLDTYIDKVLARADRTRTAPVVLGTGELGDLADVAQAAILRHNGKYLAAAGVHYQIRAHLHVVPDVLTPSTDEAVVEWVESRMYEVAGDLFGDFQVSTERDRALIEAVRDAVVVRHRAKLRTIIRYFPGYHREGEIFLQPRVDPGATVRLPNEPRRQARWITLGVAVHEALHAVAHPDFRRAADNLQDSDLATEGFAEFFTREIYSALEEAAARDADLKVAIEGFPGTFRNPPARTAYAKAVEKIGELVTALGGNVENLRAAYFAGRLEYLGMGGWNETEAARRRFPAHTLDLGIAGLFGPTTEGAFRARYARVAYGRGGRLQIHLGGTISYLGDGQRLGLGAAGFLQYSWPDVYVRAGLDVGASAAPTRPVGGSLRLDVIPGVEAGVRLGVLRVGAASYLVIPVAGGPIDERTVRLALGLGLSASF
jgi:hypothetical protein